MPPRKKKKNQQKFVVDRKGATEEQFNRAVLKQRRQKRQRGESLKAVPSKPRNIPQKVQEKPSKKTKKLNLVQGKILGQRFQLPAQERTPGAEAEILSAQVGGIPGAISKTGRVAAKALNTFRLERNQRNIERIAVLTKTKSRSVEKIIRKKLLNTEADKFIKEVSVSSLANSLKSPIIKGVTAIASADVIFQWYALDNILTGQKFHLQRIESSLRNGQISQEEAEELIDESKQTRDIAISKVIQSNSINPLMWAFRNFIMTGVEADERDLQLIEDNIRGNIQNEAPDEI